MRNKKRVLVAYANPRDTARLRLGGEDRVCHEAIHRSRHRKRVTVDVKHACTISDLRRSLLDAEYDILQISSHGTVSGLLLETEDGESRMVPQEALADLLAAYAPPRGTLQCVILNSCHSLSTGRLASMRVPYIIAMEGEISDMACLEFTRGFFDAIGVGRDYEAAYAEGDLARRLAAPDEPFVARLLRQGDHL